MTVYVIADADGADLVFKVATEYRGISTLYRLAGEAGRIDGNPYLVYGTQVEKWAQIDKYKTTICVARVRSGKLA